MMSSPRFSSTESGDNVKTLLLTPLAALALVAATSPVHAFGNINAGCAAPCNGLCTPHMTVKWVEQTVTDYRTEFEKKKVEVEVEQPDETSIEKKTYTRVVEELAFVKRLDIKPIIALVPRYSMKQVTTYKMVPCTTTDCTGKCHTTYSVKTCVESVPVTAYECVEKKQQVEVTTAYMKPVVKTYQVESWVPKYKKVKMIKEELCPKQVPYERKIQVQVCVPCGEAIAEPKTPDTTDKKN
jgi:hypothetical protein